MQTFSYLVDASRTTACGIAVAAFTFFTPEPAQAQVSADPATTVEQSRFRATGQASGIDARAATASQSGAGGSAGYGPFSLRGNYSSSSSAGLTRARIGSVSVEAATVRGSNVEANGTATNVRLENATADIGVVSIGKGANN